MDDRAVEQEIVDKGLDKAPRVSMDQMLAAIVGETVTVLPNGRTTIVQLTLDNGFTVEGSSAAVSIENFDAELGARIARQRAQDEVWKLLGFRLADQVKARRVNEHSRATGSPRYRDAGTGLYVSAEYAAANPGTTVKESSREGV